MTTIGLLTYELLGLDQGLCVKSNERTKHITLPLVFVWGNSFILMYLYDHLIRYNFGKATLIIQRLLFFFSLSKYHLIKTDKQTLTKQSLKFYR